MVVTGRLMDPVNRRGTCRSFKRYLIKMVEEGLQATDDLEEDRMCIVYDRRGLEFQHIDPNMFNFCKPLIEEMQVSSQFHELLCCSRCCRLRGGLPCVFQPGG